ncbi:hypothetical protein C8F01DRAFT_1370181 [Mycena amicta]|nr:hypothetical protein C8F01DRAFT_1370181 [Mycena amicta]
MSAMVYGRCRSQGPGPKTLSILLLYLAFTQERENDDNPPKTGPQTPRRRSREWLPVAGWQRSDTGRLPSRPHRSAGRQELAKSICMFFYKTLSAISYSFHVFKFSTRDSNNGHHFQIIQGLIVRVYGSPMHGVPLLSGIAIRLGRCRAKSRSELGVRRLPSMRSADHDLTFAVRKKPGRSSEYVRQKRLPDYWYIIPAPDRTELPTKGLGLSCGRVDPAPQH